MGIVSLPDISHSTLTILEVCNYMQVQQLAESDTCDHFNMGCKRSSSCVFQIDGSCCARSCASFHLVFAHTAACAIASSLQCASLRHHSRFCTAGRYTVSPCRLCRASCGVSQTDASHSCMLCSNTCTACCLHLVFGQPARFMHMMIMLSQLCQVPKCFHWIAVSNAQEQRGRWPPLLCWPLQEWVHLQTQR